MFVNITKSQIINTDQIVMVNLETKEVRDVTVRSYKVAEQYWQHLLRELTAMNTKARP